MEIASHLFRLTGGRIRRLRRPRCMRHCRLPNASVVTVAKTFACNRWSQSCTLEGRGDLLTMRHALGIIRTGLIVTALIGPAIAQNQAYPNTKTPSSPTTSGYTGHNNSTTDTTHPSSLPPDSQSPASRTSDVPTAPSSDYAYNGARSSYSNSFNFGWFGLLGLAGLLGLRKNSSSSDRNDRMRNSAMR